MAKTERPFILYDDILLSHLQQRKTNRHAPHIRRSVGLQPFEDLEHLPLIKALFHEKYTVADRLLKNLSEPLPPKDAVAACLCTLNSTERRMNALLDHCPPIPDFQFLGVGKTASLLDVTVRCGKHKMLALFLKRGADPNGGPTTLTAAPPLETAFCLNAYLCLEQLLKSPRLRPELTEDMLDHWACLQPDPADSSPEDLMCCQILKEALTGEAIDFLDPLPFPPQLQLKTVIEQLNFPLAAHICRSRALSEEEKQDASTYFSTHCRFSLLDNRALDFHLQDHRQHAEFLLALLANDPGMAQRPEMRFPIAATALVPPRPDALLQHWAAQLEPGPIFLPELSAAGGTYSGGLPVPRLFSNFTLSKYLFPRWDERLGRHLVPTIDVSGKFFLPFMDEEEIRLVLDRVSFVGERPTDRISPASMQFLLYAPEHFFDELMQPGGLLSLEHPRPLLDACMELSPGRRNRILPHLHKEVDYDL